MNTTPSDLILHHCPESRSMRTLWLLEELNMNYQLVSYNLNQGLRSAQYLCIHPLGRVPALQIDDMVLFESGAITEYVCELSDNKTLYREPKSKERGQWLQWLHFSETMGTHIANLTQQFIVLNPPELRSPIIIKLEVRRLEKTLEVVEQTVLNQPFLLQSGFSAADIHIGYSLHAARLFTDLSQFPAVYEYYQQLAKRQAFQKTLPSPDDPNRFYLQDSYRLDQ